MSRRTSTYSVGNNTSTNDTARLRTVESSLKRLSEVRLTNTVRYGESSIGCHTFPEWIGYVQSVREPDQARNALYYGFQPLFDALVDNNASNGTRPVAVQLLNELMHCGTDFLTGYYTGEPDVAGFKAAVRRLEPRMHQLADVPYRTKFRNIDYYGGEARPQDVLYFLKRFLEYGLDGKLKLPDYIVGCACGASEIVMPLARLAGTPLGLARNSKRRSDSRVKIITEHLPELKGRALTKDVVCIEDYVCIGHSLKGVMDEMKRLGARSVTGASLHNNYSYELTRELGMDVKEPAFHVFSRR